MEPNLTGSSAGVEEAAAWLLAPLSRLPKTGSVILTALHSLLPSRGADGPAIFDLLCHLPRKIAAQHVIAHASEAESGDVVRLLLTIDAHEPPRRAKMPYRIRAYDGEGFVTLVFFRGARGWLEKAWPEGEELLVSGKIENRKGQWQMVHPEVLTADQAGTSETGMVVYPVTEGLSQPVMRRLMHAAVAGLPLMDEWHDPALMAREKWPDFVEAMRVMHSAGTEAGQELARLRLAYDEAVALHLSLKLARQQRQQVKKTDLPRPVVGDLTRRLRESLPFSLTDAQEEALVAIADDMLGDQAMCRLLQGDVGSGKTLVGLLSMLPLIEAGYQCVMMAPTDLLARQHAESIQRMVAPLDLTVALLTGRDGTSAQRRGREQVASGMASIVVGTHALFQEKVIYQKLGLIVIDEQHRFGVSERMRLSEKGEDAHLLVMTATPIPRSLVLTAYGDMSVTRMHGLPRGRQPIETRVMSLGKIDKLMEGLARVMARGERVYWVCPLISESEVMDLANVAERCAALQAALGEEQVGLVHGQLPQEERDETMRAFRSGSIRVLVATTVIEVGVDVPEATLIVIEQAERFGLAQLHQLRGRVGRGERASNCILLYKSPLTKSGKMRLESLRDSTDGFEIAEQDLKLRGPGEVLGTRQSGLPDFRFLDVIEHRRLIELAHTDVQMRLEVPRRDPGTELLMILFDYLRRAPVLGAG